MHCEDPTTATCKPPGRAPSVSVAADVLPADDQAFNETLARLAKALGHPARVAIVRMLMRRKDCVCGAIVDELPLAQSTVSQHLKVLKEAGLVRGEIDGPRVSYCINPTTVAQLRVLVALL